MAATPRVHHFDAAAHVFNAQIQHPIQRDVKPHTLVQLAEEGGYFSQEADSYEMEKLVSFRSAYTQVTGHKSPKPGHGWVTVATSVIEGLNIHEVVTADRVVAQISTEHPLVGYVPSVTFVGSRFENLKIGGYDANAEMNYDICGSKPKGDKPHIEDSAFLGRVAQQYAKIARGKKLPDWVRDKYDKDLLSPRKIKKDGDKAKVECSLVTQVDEGPHGTVFGHVIDVPEFGKIFLAEVTAERNTFHLTMIRVEMGCIATGTGGFATAKSNGSTQP